MEAYEPLSDNESVEDIANNMIQQVSMAFGSVFIEYDGDTIEVHVSNDRQIVTINWNETMAEVHYMDSIFALRVVLEEVIRQQAFAEGKKDAAAGREPKYPNYPDYMDGYNEGDV